MRLVELFEPRKLPWVNSPEFKNWFKGSKVVDANGNPRVVFHGTFEDFTVFKLESEKRRAYGFNRLGFWFDVNHETPNYFTGYTPTAQKAGNVVLAFLSIKKPLSEPLSAADQATLRKNPGDATASKFDRQDSFDHMIGQIANLYEYELMQDAPKIDWQNMEWRKKEQKLRKLACRNERVIALFRQDMIAEGYDGIYLPNTLADNGTRGGVPTDWWVAFHPNQIKAALGNKGTFSKDSEDITERAKVRISENTAQYYFVSEIVDSILTRGIVPK